MKLSKRIFLALLIIIFVAGCSSKEKQPFTKLEAGQKFVKLLENDYGLQPVVRWLENTLWIYVPNENPLYQIAGSKKPSCPVKKTYTIQYANVNFNNNIFEVEYDIVPATKLLPSKGMSTKYSPEFNEQYRNVTSAISRTFFNSENPPEFIVLVAADILNGLQAKTIFHTLDLKKYFSQALPPDEYALRAKTESSGNEKIIGDKEGKYLEIKEISMPEFLAKQMAYRISFKFQNSDFPPEKSIDDEILNAITKTLQAYNFNNFSEVVLKDLREGNEKSFSKDQINTLRKTLPKEKLVEQGKVITIDFSDLMKNQN